MRTFARTIALAAVTALVSLGATPAASADQPAGDPSCAKQEQQVAKAEDALARVTAVFERQKDKVAKAQEALAAATTPEEQAKAQQALDRALAKKADAKKAKKAQVKRLAHAEERLADCQAGLPV